jgi:hypothetical protein
MLKYVHPKPFALIKYHIPEIYQINTPGSERRSAVEAIGRFINQSPGCRQGTIFKLAPVAVWQPLPCSGAVSALGHFGTRTRPRGRARHATSNATDSDAAGIDSGERSDACRAERSQLRSRKRALREQATSVWRARHDPGGRPGDWASDNLPRRSRPERCRSRPAQGHGPRSRGPESTAASAAGAAAFTMADGWDIKQSITSLTQLYLTW